ncbi:hypothetical protein AB7W30_00150 [Providencia manganoxydans]
MFSTPEETFEWYANELKKYQNCLQDIFLMIPTVNKITEVKLMKLSD